MDTSDLLPEKINVVIADDHEIVRAGLRRILNIDKRIQIVGEAVDGESALKLIEENLPHVALLDIHMPVLDGIEVAKIVCEKHPEIVVIMLTAYEDYKHVEEALKVGADGYLSKDISPSFLIDAIYRSLLGERVFSKSILRVLENPLLSHQEIENSNVTITPREQEILNYLAQGKTSKEIADILGISIRTVQNHRSNIMQKLGIKTAAGLVRFAVLHTSKFKSPE
ncbi:DNA-binding response regulator [Bacteroidetes/Chlorobi group bacterium MS-B_bin-24]|jgi:DNA-binding NarL/FixJ family response regulator|nr:MAG: DNA-binding response regulator [Bacteroidetes/Chlorobi group bacterium MS-B_bin-24]